VALSSPAKKASFSDTETGRWGIFNPQHLSNASWLRGGQILRSAMKKKEKGKNADSCNVIPITGEPSPAHSHSRHREGRRRCVRLAGRRGRGRTPPRPAEALRTEERPGPGGGRRALEGGIQGSRPRGGGTIRDPQRGGSGTPPAPAWSPDHQP